jgi:hypothetical protein
MNADDNPGMANYRGTESYLADGQVVGALPLSIHRKDMRLAQAPLQVFRFIEVSDLSCFK